MLNLGGVQDLGLLGAVLAPSALALHLELLVGGQGLLGLEIRDARGLFTIFLLALALGLSDIVVVLLFGVDLARGQTHTKLTGLEDAGLSPKRKHFN